ncbi:MAG: hypothetical protein ABIN89_15980 [Chitinophagaceae bacterium]
MKPVFLMAFYLLGNSGLFAQGKDNTVNILERSVEVLAEKTGVEMEDDSYLLQLENLKKHPLNLNYADEDELKELLMLNDLQIENFLNYRRLLGKLLDIYELQAIPSWNINIIQKLLPFITISQNIRFADNIKERWADGNHNLLIRTSQVLEKADGFLAKPDSGNHYLGNASRLMVRYSYNYRNLLQWGILGDKDAGEQFFNGKQKAGFDFYSFHFFVTRLGFIRSLVIGDFTVNMGQGLIQWQGMAFKKSAEISTVKRQSPVLRPYTAAGEYNFHRGGGITIQKGKWETTMFLSVRNLSGNKVKDSVMDKGHISSFLVSGYNRTPSELEDRNNFQQLAAGASIKYAVERWHIAVNAVQFKLSLPFQKEDRPYNLFTPSGRIFANESIDYSYTYKNCHLFGEAAIDKKLNKALLNGLLVSLSPGVDLSIIYRSISRSYQSFYADAFTENGAPVNEKGLFAGLCIRPSDQVQINAYTDGYHFPWLKYRVDAPSSGREYFLQVLYKPNKQVEFYTFFSNESKQQNVSGGNLTTGILENSVRQNWRINSNISISRAITLRNRVEAIFYNKKQANEEEGFLLFTDILYKPVLKHWSGNMRLLYFETTGYNSRLYAYENDVLYGFSIPSIFDKGFRYYINVHLDVSARVKKIGAKRIKTECWLKVAQTSYLNKRSIGSGTDTINGNKKTEIKFQLLFAL